MSGTNTVVELNANEGIIKNELDYLIVGQNPVHTMTDASFETTVYHYKIYRQWLNGSKIAPMISPPWFKCLKGPVKLSDTTSGNFYANSDSFQFVKLASVSISKS